MGFWSFIKAHLLPSIMMALGAVWAAIGFTSQAHDIWTAGLEPWQTQLSGFAIFVIGVFAILYQFKANQHFTPEAFPPEDANLIADFTGKKSNDIDDNIKIAEERDFASGGNYLDPNLKPSDLIKLATGRTELQANHIWKPYIGQRMIVSGPVLEVGKNLSGYSIMLGEVTDEKRHSLPTSHLFFRENQGDQLFFIDKGKEIRASGRINSFSVLGFLVLDDCEILPGPVQGQP